jgi:hypothetical protein
MASFDVPYIAQRYRTIGQKYQPDMLVWFESGSGFSRYNEYMMPLIHACETETADIPDSETKTYYGCWDKASTQLVEEYPAVKLAETFKPYLDSFSEVTKTAKTFFLSFEVSGQDDRSVDMISQYRQWYPDITFASIVPDLRREETLPDRHPNVRGHEAIAQAIYAYLQEPLSQLCR